MMLISIIIPVYNVEKYVSICINSILEQVFEDYEIILVDDGSKDRSGSICDEYREKDSRISVIHKTNGGLSDARNAGLKQAKGEYLLFVDSDDYIGENSLQSIAKCVESQPQRTDVMFLEAYKIFPDGQTVSLGDGYQSEYINGKDKQTVMKHLAELPKYPGSACTKLIRRKLVIENNLVFKKGLLSEDIDWTIALLKAAENFAYCDVDYYYYRQDRAGSITNTANIKNVESLLYIVKKWADKNQKELFQNEINAFMAYEYMIALYNYAGLDKEGQQKTKQTFKEYVWIMKYARTKKTKLVGCCCRILGIQLTAALLRKGYRSR